MQAQLAKRFASLKRSLTQEELENYKLLLCMAAGGLAPRGSRPHSEASAAAFRTVLQCLSDMRVQGTMWRGRPACVTDIVLASLQEESRCTREIAKPTDRYLLGCGGTVADQFALDRDLKRFVQDLYPGVEPTGVASYIYYDGQGHGLDPHVDTEVYEINVIVMLEHLHPVDAEPSHLLIYEDDVSPRRILLAPGEVVVLNAGSVVHAREDMKPGERVSILTVGFSNQVQ
ncbi:hypothetical protein [Roseateles depolymerans]|uniref:Uncharacterized protein n=1 Tax=Roseateles depolymerans TaxID=76731 RepID=A0A0U3E2L1_9BURK|nr:hypothetical protein [Roseateles depolymerans]ALV07413.1 hypothetical protein RD2015_2951 [Roseateles depolymerans]REG22373.1 hypothetical protein DES44_1521 [Roseateles depolymerans]